MLKKLLTLSLVAVILSVTAFAAPDAISPISRALANEGLPVTIAVSQNNAVINDTTGLGGTVTLAVTSDAAYADAIVVTAVFDGTSFLTASITDAALTAGTNTKAITLPTALTTANNSYNVKFYLWESKTTLEPIAQPYALNVIPQADTPDVWSGETPTEADKPAYDEATNTYSIATADELAWFSKNAEKDDTNYITANVVLTDDIYLNAFFEADGSFDKDWYEDPAKVATAKPWVSDTVDYMIGNTDGTTSRYTGSFDGDGHTIYGLYCTPADGAGAALFGYMGTGTDGEIKDLNMVGAYVVSNDTTTTPAQPKSVLCANTRHTVANVTVDGKITAAAGKYAYFAGSVVGHVIGTGATISNCTSHVTIDLSDGATTAVSTTKTNRAKTLGVGGIVGVKSGGSKAGAVIENCVNYGELNCPYNVRVGGILGAGVAYVTVKGCSVAQGTNITYYETIGTYDGCGEIVGYDNGSLVTVE